MFFSNDDNLQKEGGSFHKKEDCLILWNTNVQRGEFSSTSVVSFPVGLHNNIVEHSWRFDVS